MRVGGALAGALAGGGGACWILGAGNTNFRNNNVGAIHLQVGGQTYLLMFLSEKWAFTAVRADLAAFLVRFGRLLIVNVLYLI